MLALVGLLSAIGGCRGNSRQPDRDGATLTTSATVDAADVTLTGQVTRSFGRYVVQLGTEPPEPVLVVLRTPNTFAVGARLEVTGRTRTFQRAGLEAELGVALGPEAEGLEGRRCLVAATVRSL